MKLSVVVVFAAFLAVASSYPSNSIEATTPSPDTTTLSTHWETFKKLLSHPVKIVHKNIKKFLYRDMCHGYECPKYDLMKKTDYYELRCYHQYTWIGTTFNGTERSLSERKAMFMKLFEYIQGKNMNKTKIKMTVPVATKTEMLGTMKRWTMLFFVPSKYQMNTPVPTDPTVSIINLPKTCVYVKTFSWFMGDEKVHRELKKLETALSKDGISDYTGAETMFYTGGYDSPWTLPFLRHNEVWLVQN